MLPIAHQGFIRGWVGVICIAWRIVHDAAIVIRSIARERIISTSNGFLVREFELSYAATLHSIMFYQPIKLLTKIMFLFHFALVQVSVALCLCVCLHGCLLCLCVVVSASLSTELTEAQSCPLPNKNPSRPDLLLSVWYLLLVISIRKNEFRGSTCPCSCVSLDRAALECQPCPSSCLASTVTTYTVYIISFMRACWCMSFPWSTTV